MRYVSKILSEFVERYPQHGLESHFSFLTYHGTTVASDHLGGAIAILPIPPVDPQYQEYLHKIFWQLANHLLATSTEVTSVCIHNRPKFGVWYWLNGDDAGEEV